VRTVLLQEPALITNKTAIFSCPRAKDDHHILMYSEAALQMLGLTREDFILMALLVGGDYSVSTKDPCLPHLTDILMKEGIKGCGINIAMELAQAGFGRRLIEEIQGKTAECASPFLVDWRADLIAELGTNTSGFLQQRHPKLALTVAPDFPDLGIINLYTHPRTSEGSGSLSWPQPIMARGPNIAALAAFTHRHFNWAEGAKLVQRFANTIFPGLAMHELVHTAHSLDQHTLRHPVILPLIGNIIAYRSHISANFIKEARINLHLPAADLAELYKIAGDPALSMKFSRFRAWISVPVLQHVLPDAIEFGPEQLDIDEGPSCDATQCTCFSCQHPSSPCSHHDLSP
jgi:hypothetical protein